jgi:acyl-CoA thioester hydrolase
VTVRFTHTRRVAFSETDAAGIVHFATFFRYFEDCEHAFLRAHGLQVHVNEPDGGFRGFPRVSASAEYLAPLRFEDAVETTLTVQEVRRSAVVYRFEVRRAGAEAVLATGLTTVVCAAREGHGGALRAQPIPGAMRSVLEG